MNSEEVDALIGQIADGDLEALNRLYTHLEDRVFALAYTVTKNSHLSEDIMQDTFIKVYEKAPTYRPRGKGAEWVMGIAKNLTKQRLQKESRYTLAGDDDRVWAVAHFEENMEGTLQARTLLSLLSRKEQDIVLLHVVAEVRLNVVAELLQLPLGSVYWSFSNARQKMKRHLQSTRPPGSPSVPTDRLPTMR